MELPKFKAKNLTEKKMQVLWLRFLTEIGEATKEAPQPRRRRNQGTASGLMFIVMVVVPVNYALLYRVSKKV